MREVARCHKKKWDPCVSGRKSQASAIIRGQAYHSRDILSRMGSSSQKDAARLRLEGEVIVYESRVHMSWRIEVRDLKLLGECTDQNGPFTDDYWLIFVTSPHMWLGASFYSEGRDELLGALSEHLNLELELKLMASVDFASRILWPAQLAGTPLFQYSPGQPSKGVLQKMRQWVLPSVFQTYTPEVLAFLASEEESEAQNKR